MCDGNYTDNLFECSRLHACIIRMYMWCELYTTTRSIDKQVKAQVIFRFLFCPFSCQIFELVFAGDALTGGTA